MASELDLGWLDPQLGSLRRARRGLGTGLCRALAARWDVDVVLVRVAFVVLALCGGVGAVVYLWGTALTPGSRGHRPVDSYMPRFPTWGRLGQQIFVLVTSVVAVSVLDPLTPLPWALGVLLLLAALVMRRPRQPGAMSSAAQPEAVSDDDLVAQWRARMNSAIGTQPDLPVVDLYAPDEALPQRPPTQPAPPASWLAATIIGAMTLAAGGIGLACGMGILWACGIALALAGVMSLLYAVFWRRSRLPKWFVTLLAMALVPAGWVATEATMPLPTSSTVIAERVVSSSKTIDLSGADLTGIDTIRVKAVAANVTVILPGPPSSSSVDNKTSMIVWGGASGDPAKPYKLEVDAAASKVELVVGQS